MSSASGGRIVEETQLVSACLEARAELAERLGCASQDAGEALLWTLAGRRSRARRYVSPGLVGVARSWCQTDASMLGPVFEALVARELRYPEGQYFTPTPLANHLADLVGDDAETVLDPAAGAGVLLAAVARPGRRLIGFDTSPLCVALAKSGLEQRGVGARIRRCDFLGPTSTPKVDAVVCNPPYQRHHFLDRGRKRQLAQSLGEVFQIRLSTLSSSYVYFLLKAATQLSPGGRLVFITPADYLDVAYGRALKDVLAHQGHLERIELFARSELAFDGVLTTSAVTVWTKRAPRRATAFVEAEIGKRGVRERSKRRADAASLDPKSSWTLQFGTRAREHRKLKTGRPKRLADYLRVRRGIATGANGFFVLRQQDVDAWDIERRFLKPVVASARDLPSGSLSRAAWRRLRDEGRRCWLLDCPLGEHELSGLHVAAYLGEGLRRGVYERFNCRTRNPWYRMEKVAPPDIIVTYMNRGQTRFVANDAGCRVMSVFLNGYLRAGVDRAALLEVLNEAPTGELIAQLGRTYGGGLRKIEPRELLELPMPELEMAEER